MVRVQIERVHPVRFRGACVTEGSTLLLCKDLLLNVGVLG